MERPSCNTQIKSRRISATALRRAGVFLFLFLAAGLLSLRAVSFTDSLDRDTVTLGDSLVLSLKFEDGGPNDAPALPQIPNLQITYIGPSSQFSFINGRTTSSVTHNFNVTP